MDSALFSSLLSTLLSTLLPTLLLFAPSASAQNFQPQSSVSSSLFDPSQQGPPLPPPQGLAPDRIDRNNFRNIDWSQVDRRQEEGWWHLYPFGEKYYDDDLTARVGSRPWHDQQLDLDFFFPFYGFRFNYTFVFPEGFIAFSYPQYIQPPYTYPDPKWPERWDPSFIAAFMSDQQVIFVGETQLSHLWYRVVYRPPNMIGKTGPGVDESGFQVHNGRRDPYATDIIKRYYKGQLLKTQVGRMEDPEFLNQLTLDIRNGQVGVRGFTADYALVVTWERMAYGGAPKYTQLNLYDRVKRWQNTYQMVIATDEIRSYVMFNYANINWTSSTSAGALFGRGGKQSAIVGFNGGNGTGFYQLPYSAEGNSYKLVQFGSTPTAGRWQARVDETPIYGGCLNTSVGSLRPHTGGMTMLGGFALNISGPCYRPNNKIKFQIDILTIDCRRIDMVVARCVIPVNGLFRAGLLDIKLSLDGGSNYAWWGKIYVITPDKSRNPVKLKDDPITTVNRWRSPEAEELTLGWSSANISTNPNSQVDVTVWGYREFFGGLELAEIGVIAKNIANTGSYSFDPRQLLRSDMEDMAWERFRGGMVQVRVSGDYLSDNGDGLYWSEAVPLGWYFKTIWQEHYGEEWALSICQEWYEYDGMWPNFMSEVMKDIPCPCTLSQALADHGRFIALPDCDQFGNSLCHYTQGAKHCVFSTVATQSGSGQMCCYDYEGWLMLSDDYEYETDYLRFYGSGTPYRAHPMGSFPYKRQFRVPSLSNFVEDLLPYDMCCEWTKACEFYYWRRQSSACIDYVNPVNGFAYGQGHFFTYDGLRYPFAGKGYFVLTTMKGPTHNLNIQVRMEQPPKTLWDEEVPATVITGVAASDNGSQVVQIFSRKEMRRERYRLDVYIGGYRAFFDRPWRKMIIFPGGVIRSPPRNMNQSEIEVMFDTGVGLKVMENRGQISLSVALPYTYNETNRYVRDENDPGRYLAEPVGVGKCHSHVRTLGLLGTFNGDQDDDLISPDCQLISVGGYSSPTLSENEIRNIYFDFGEKWRVDGIRNKLLFQTKFRPLYNPLTFGQKNFVPTFDPFRNTNVSYWQSLIFTPNQVKGTCQGLASCEYDYMTSGRKEVALETLHSEKKFAGVKHRGEQKLLSCGALMKNRGVLKYPVGNTYLDGVTVTFACRPDYFLHGDTSRTCRNGTWSPGWWVWCRARNEEAGLKWMTGIIVSLLILTVIISLFVYCYCLRKKATKSRTPPNHKFAPSNHVSGGNWGVGEKAEDAGFRPVYATPPAIFPESFVSGTSV